MRRGSIVLGGVLALVGCGAPASVERAEAQLGEATRAWAPGAPAQAEELPEWSGQLDGYVDWALRSHPGLRAEHAAWRAEVAAARAAWAWPATTFSYGLFVRRVETRVGPQRHRLGVTQPIPWLPELDAAARASALRAEAGRARHDAMMLTVREQVARRYWGVWAIARRRVRRREQLALLEGLASILRGRVEVGASTLAELQRVELEITRLREDLDALDDQEAAARARLAALLGAPDPADLPVTPAQVPGPQAVDLELDALLARIEDHPQLEVLAQLDRASQAELERAQASGGPDFAVGVDYIETGPAAMDGVPDSGKDPVVAMIAVKIPLWRQHIDAAQEAARARGVAARARRELAARELVAGARVAWSELEDARRRIQRRTDALLPQARSLYESALGAYEVGRGSISEVIAAQQAMLALELELERARADLAISIARLEQLTGQPLQTGGPP